MASKSGTGSASKSGSSDSVNKSGGWSDTPKSLNPGSSNDGNTYYKQDSSGNPGNSSYYDQLAGNNAAEAQRQAEARTAAANAAAAQQRAAEAAAAAARAEAARVAEAKRVAEARRVAANAANEKAIAAQREATQKAQSAQRNVENQRAEQNEQRAAQNKTPAAKPAATPRPAAQPVARPTSSQANVNAQRAEQNAQRTVTPAKPVPAAPRYVAPAAPVVRAPTSSQSNINTQRAEQNTQRATQAAKTALTTALTSPTVKSNFDPYAGTWIDSAVNKGYNANKASTPTPVSLGSSSSSNRSEQRAEQAVQRAVAAPAKTPSSNIVEAAFSKLAETPKSSVAASLLPSSSSSNINNQRAEQIAQQNRAKTLQNYDVNAIVNSQKKTPLGPVIPSLDMQLAKGSPVPFTVESPKLNTAGNVQLPTAYATQPPLSPNGKVTVPTLNKGDAIDAFMADVVAVESGGNPNARNPSSSATGSTQFISSTWIDMMERKFPERIAGLNRSEILDLRYDHELSVAAGREYAKENAERLERQGHEVTPESLYAAHFLGPQGANRYLNALAADPSTPIRQAVDPATYASNRSIFERYNTVGEVAAWMDRKFSSETVGPEYADNNTLLNAAPVAPKTSTNTAMQPSAPARLPPIAPPSSNPNIKIENGYEYDARTNELLGHDRYGNQLPGYQLPRDRPGYQAPVVATPSSNGVSSNSVQQQREEQRFMAEVARQREQKAASGGKYTPVVGTGFSGGGQAPYVSPQKSNLDQQRLEQQIVRQGTTPVTKTATIPNVIPGPNPVPKDETRLATSGYPPEVPRTPVQDPSVVPVGKPQPGVVEVAAPSEVQKPGVVEVVPLPRNRPSRTAQGDGALPVGAQPNTANNNVPRTMSGATAPVPADRIERKSDYGWLPYGIGDFLDAAENSSGPFDNTIDNHLYNIFRGGDFNLPSTATHISTSGYLFRKEADGTYTNVGRADPSLSPSETYDRANTGYWNPESPNYGTVVEQPRNIDAEIPQSLNPGSVNDETPATTGLGGLTAEQIAALLAMFQNQNQTPTPSTPIPPAIPNVGQGLFETKNVGNVNSGHEDQIRTAILQAQKNISVGLGNAADYSLLNKYGVA